MIDSSTFERLRAIGMTPALMAQAAQAAQAAQGGLAASPGELLRVTEVQREGMSLHDGAAERPARMLPALRHRLAAEADAIAVGDWVLAERNALGEWWAHERVPPLNQLARRLHDGRDKVVRAVIVSNVDTALLVMGLDQDYNPRRLQRYVALVRMAGVAAVVVLTKADLSARADECLREVQSGLPADVPALAVNGLGSDPARSLTPWLAVGQTLVLLGSSGAGKSTLTNALLGSEAQRTGASRADDGRGRHTTTARSLHLTAQGACIIDTPGLRTLRLDGDAEALQSAFGDIGQLALLCRFRDCRHHQEPGCAVREGVSAERLQGFHKLQREARRDTLSALERKAQVQQWKARGRESRLRIEGKRGEGG
jgi:ribosome biogenesis GTPase